MGISNKYKVALQTYIDKLQEQIYNYQPSCWASIFGSNKTKLWETKINAMQHILDYGDQASVSDLKKDLSNKIEFRGWDSGLYSNTESKINDALKSMEKNEKVNRYNSQSVRTGHDQMTNGRTMGTNIQEATLYSTDTYNNTENTNLNL